MLIKVITEKFLSFFAIEKQIWTTTVKVISHRYLADRRVIEAVPPSIDRVFTISCIVTIIYFT